MAIDMKETIAKATVTLLLDKHVKKLTVKNIVEECHITRQTFYYHFEDSPDLLNWMLEKGMDHSLAILGLLRDWAEEDSRNIDSIVHEILLLVTGGVTPFSRKELQAF